MKTTTDRCNVTTSYGVEKCEHTGMWIAHNGPGMSGEFKTEGGAVRFMAKRGMDRDGNITDGNTIPNKA
jgi:hypothetical protein